MLRNEWKFPYKSADLGKAAHSKQVHHEGRVRWWEAQQKRIAAEAGKKGLELIEAVGASYSVSNAMHGKQLVVQGKYQMKLNECHQKLVEHRGKTETYAGWVQVLRANPKQVVDLNHDDYLFFFGK